MIGELSVGNILPMSLVRCYSSDYLIFLCSLLTLDPSLSQQENQNAIQMCGFSFEL